MNNLEILQGPIDLPSPKLNPADLLPDATSARRRAGAQQRRRSVTNDLTGTDDFTQVDNLPFSGTAEALAQRRTITSERNLRSAQNQIDELKPTEIDLVEIFPDNEFGPKGLPKFDKPPSRGISAARKKELQASVEKDNIRLRARLAEQERVKVLGSADTVITATARPGTASTVVTDSTRLGSADTVVAPQATGLLGRAKAALADRNRLRLDTRGNNTQRGAIEIGKVPGPRSTALAREAERNAKIAERQRPTRSPLGPDATFLQKLDAFVDPRPLGPPLKQLGPGDSAIVAGQRQAAEFRRANPKTRSDVSPLRQEGGSRFDGTRASLRELQREEARAAALARQTKIQDTELALVEASRTAPPRRRFEGAGEEVRKAQTAFGDAFDEARPFQLNFADQAASNILQRNRFGNRHGAPLTSDGLAT